MSRGREHWWNAEFDLSLRDEWDPRVGLADSRLVRELSLHGLLAAAPGESVRVDVEPSESFLEYLRARQVAIPQITVSPAIRRGARFAPVGWNRRAIELNRSYDVPSAHPAFDVIQRVNSKLFSHEVERRLNGPSPMTVARSVADVDDAVLSMPEGSHGLVAKMEHGNSGLGNRRLPARPPDAEDRRWLARALSAGPLLIEPWLQRSMDLSTLFRVDERGRVYDLAVHEVVSTAAGALIGAIYDGDAARVAPWCDALSDVAQIVGRALNEQGYWGPVCLDSFVWRDATGIEVLRPLVEINARRHASAHWRRLAVAWGGCSYGRFVTARKLNLPEDEQTFDDQLGDLAWDRAEKRGVLLTSPLSYRWHGQRTRPRKIGLLLRGRSRDEVLRMEAGFRRRFER